jgi:hypothetical protein
MERDQLDRDIQINRLCTSSSRLKEEPANPAFTMSRNNENAGLSQASMFETYDFRLRTFAIVHLACRAELRHAA